MRNRRWLNHGCARDLCGTVILCGRKWKLHAGPVNNLVGSSTAPNCKGRLWVRRPHARHLPATASRELVDAPASSGIARRTSNVHLMRQACRRNIPAINERCKKKLSCFIPQFLLSINHLQILKPLWHRFVLKIMPHGKWKHARSTWLCKLICKCLSKKLTVQWW